MYRGRALAAEQLAKVHDRAAADGDNTVILVVRNGLVHGFDHSLRGLAGAKLLLENILALQAVLLHEGLVDEFVGQDDVALTELELIGKLAEVRKLVNGGGDDDLSLVLHQGGAESIHSHN